MRDLSTLTRDEMEGTLDAAFRAVLGAAYVEVFDVGASAESKISKRTVARRLRDRGMPLQAIAEVLDVAGRGNALARWLK